jgi:hypothetical protein
VRGPTPIRRARGGLPARAPAGGVFASVWAAGDPRRSRHRSLPDLQPRAGPARQTASSHPPVLRSTSAVTVRRWIVEISSGSSPLFAGVDARQNTRQGERGRKMPDGGIVRRMAEAHAPILDPDDGLAAAPDVPGRVSAELAAWVSSDADKTLGGLVEVFNKRAFAIVFVMLLGVPALPLPTGGATHVFEAIAVVLALELVAGRDEIWLPRRWRARKLATGGRFMRALLRAVARLERLSRPRLRVLFGHRASNVVFGVLVAAGSTAAFLAPPFTGLDTLPALGVVLVALGVLFEDVLFVALGLAVGAAGVVLEIFVGSAALMGLNSLL